MDALIILMRSTQKKAALLMRGDFAVRAVPYLACLLFVEIYYLLLKISMVYGTVPAVVSGALMVALLFAAVLGAGLGYPAPVIICAVACELHGAFSLSSAALALAQSASPGPPWLLIIRYTAAPFEILFALVAVARLGRGK